MKKRTFTLSTGNVFKGMDPNDIDNVISFLESLDLDIDGYMLSLATIYDDKDLKISDDTMGVLKSKTFNSIHAPVTGYEDDDMTRRLLAKIKEIYDSIGANHIVFHPYGIKDYGILTDTGMKCLIEFMLPRNNLEIKDYSNILDENPKIDFTHDICHAAQHSISKVKEVTEIFKDRIKQVHISYADGNNWHLPMFRSSKEFLDAAGCVKRMDKNIEFSNEAKMFEPEIIKKKLSSVENG